MVSLSQNDILLFNSPHLINNHSGLKATLFPRRIILKGNFDAKNIKIASCIWYLKKKKKTTKAHNSDCPPANLFAQRVNTMSGYLKVLRKLLWPLKLSQF